MQYKKRLLAIFLSVLCIWTFAACGKDETEDIQNIVYKFGDCTITFGEFYVYAKTVEEDYQKTYGNGVWSLELTTDDGKSTVRDVTIKDLINNINRIKVYILK